MTSLQSDMLCVSISKRVHLPAGVTLSAFRLLTQSNGSGMPFLSLEAILSENYQLAHLSTANDPPPMVSMDAPSRELAMRIMGFHPTGSRESEPPHFDSTAVMFYMFAPTFGHWLQLRRCRKPPSQSLGVFYWLCCKRGPYLASQLLCSTSALLF